MKKLYFIIYIFIYICVSTVICLKVAQGGSSDGREADTTGINRRLINVEENWTDVSAKDKEVVSKEDSFDYTVIDSDGCVLIMTKSDMAQSVSSATSHYDIIRDVEVDGRVVGHMIVHNPAAESERARSIRYAYLLAALLAGVLILIIGYFVYINHCVVRPFHNMKKFATRIAVGDLDTPLQMDKGHVFGEFTEAFDIMREELKASREREEAAVKSRKELVAELSHDIKTPVASIKAMAEVMSLTARDDAERDTIAAINGKADQIDRLISNLFHATLEELEQLEVNVEELSSEDIRQMIQEADYMKKVSEIEISDAVIVCDKLRINQVITNIIANSYKYAGTDISVRSRYEGDIYAIDISDKGGGIPESELEVITEKFKRGSNAEGKDGSGLGLYISKYLLEKMGGGLVCTNNGEGLTVTIRVKTA